MEGYLARRGMTDRDPRLDRSPYHMLLLAKNMTGYQNLMKIASASQLEGFYYHPRVDKEFLAKHAEGLIATSGCLAAEIPRLVSNAPTIKLPRASKSAGIRTSSAQKTFTSNCRATTYSALDGLNRWLCEYRRSGHSARRSCSPPMTCIMSIRDDADAHDTLLCIQTSSLKSESDRMKMEPFNSYYPQIGC